MLNEFKIGMIPMKKHENCCPGHDPFPTESYKNKRSKKALAKGKRLVHRYARRRDKQQIKKESNDDA